MELRNIITFIKVTELQSFSKAALALGYSQSNITMQIKQLEQDLNCALFNLIGKKYPLVNTIIKIGPKLWSSKAKYK